MSSSPASQRPDCFACKSFFITYEMGTPYACRAFGLKSRNLPSMAVFQSSGKHCQLFEAKPRLSKPPKK